MDYEKAYNELLATHEGLKNEYDTLQRVHNDYVNTNNERIINKAINEGLDRIKFTNNNIRNLVIKHSDKSTLIVDENGNVDGINDYIETLKDEYPECLANEIIVGGGPGIPSSAHEPNAEPNKISFFD